MKSRSLLAVLIFALGGCAVYEDGAPTAGYEAYPDYRYGYPLGYPAYGVGVYRGGYPYYDRSHRSHHPHPPHSHAPHSHAPLRAAPANPGAVIGAPNHRGVQRALPSARGAGRR